MKNEIELEDYVLITDAENLCGYEEITATKGSTCSGKDVGGQLFPGRPLPSKILEQALMLITIQLSEAMFHHPEFRKGCDVELRWKIIKRKQFRSTK